MASSDRGPGSIFGEEKTMSRVVTYPLPGVVIPARATVGEGPVFDRRTGRFCWVDINQGLLFENDLRSGDQRRWSVDTMVGAAAPRATRLFVFERGPRLLVVHAARRAALCNMMRLS